MLAALRVPSATAPLPLPSYECPRVVRALLSVDACAAALDGLLHAAAGDSVQDETALVSVGAGGSYSGTPDAAGVAAVPTPLAAFVRSALRAPAAAAAAVDAPQYLCQHALSTASGPLARALLSRLPAAGALWPARGGGGGAAAHLWLASGGSTRTRAHYDDEDSVLLVLRGAKAVALAAPTLALLPAVQPALARASDASAFHHVPALDLFALAAAAAEAGSGGGGGGDGAAAGARVLAGVVELAPGDALVLPAGWWHEVRSTAHTAAVNWWWPTLATAAPLGEEDSAARAAAWPYRLRREVVAGLQALEAMAHADWRRACASSGARSLPADAAGVAALLRLGGGGGGGAAPAPLDIALVSAEPLDALRRLAELAVAAPAALSDLAAAAAPETWAALADAWEDAGDASARLGGGPACLGDAFAAINAALAPPAGALRAALLGRARELTRLQTTAPLSALLETCQADVRERCLRRLLAAAALGGEERRHA